MAWAGSARFLTRTTPIGLRATRCVHSIADTFLVVVISFERHNSILSYAWEPDALPRGYASGTQYYTKKENFEGVKKIIENIEYEKIKRLKEHRTYKNEYIVIKRRTGNIN